MTDFDRVAARERRDETRTRAAHEFANTNGHDPAAIRAVDALLLAYDQTSSDLSLALARVDAVEKERDALKRENEALRALYEFMWNEHGFTDAGDHPATTWEATARIEELCGAIEQAEIARQRSVSVEEGTEL